MFYAVLSDIQPEKGGIPEARMHLPPYNPHSELLKYIRQVHVLRKSFCNGFQQLFVTRSSIDSNASFFIFRQIRGKNRSLTATWLMNHHWLRYSESRDAVCCAPCILCGSRDSKEKTLGLNSPQSDWANTGHDVKRHTQQGSMHHKNVQSAEEFISSREGEKPDICMSMSKSYNNNV